MLDTKKAAVQKKAVRQKDETPGTKTLPSVSQGNHSAVKQLKSSSLFPPVQLKEEKAPVFKPKEETVYRKTW